jgi:hypothetical protein
MKGRISPLKSLVRLISIHGLTFPEYIRGNLKKGERNG